jgi:hypothetical protein
MFLSQPTQTYQLGRHLDDSDSDRTVELDSYLDTGFNLED